MFEREGDRLVGRRGAGGLVGAVAAVFTSASGTWIAAALSDGDKELARSHPRGRDEDGFRLRLLELPADAHQLHYDAVSNEALWFLFHYLFDVPNLPAFDSSFARAWEGYRQVNHLYADAVIEARPADAVLVQDYHLMLVGAELRRRTRVRRPILYFHHTPWCHPDYFSLLPADIGREILESLLAYDVVGFHARRWADAFSSCCERLLEGAEVSGDDISWRRRSTRILVAPVPLDTKRLTEEASDVRTQDAMAEHEEIRAGRRLLLRVDRIDLSKNPLRGFLAFEALLQRRPELARESVFLALLYPSRLNVASYRRYFTECLGIVRRVNERFEGKTDAPGGPIELHFQDQYHRSLAAMRMADALLVNPIFDGLNLVAKEGAYVNERDGTLILSRNAGVFEEIGAGAMPINPFDVTQTADVIERALEMSPPERARGAKRLKRLAARSTPLDWAQAQLAAAGLESSST